MPRSFRVPVLASLLTLAACLSPQQRISNREDNLSAAGFVIRPANTPQRDAMLQRLPPNKFSRSVKGDQVSYVYPDPVVCHCLYTGTQQAYNTYQANLQQQRLADEQAMTADEFQDASWDWGPWGFGGGFGPGF